MSEWKSIEKDGYPKKPCFCVVSNNVCNCRILMAVFQSEGKLFYNLEHAPEDFFPLSVTHYIEIPDKPKIEGSCEHYL